jgi:hypothetical protein
MSLQSCLVYTRTGCFNIAIFLSPYANSSRRDIQKETHLKEDILERSLEISGMRKSRRATTI